MLRNPGTEPEPVLSHLLSADIVVLVLDPVRLLSSPITSHLLPVLLRKGCLHLIINGHLPSNCSEEQIKATLNAQLADITSEAKLAEWNGQLPPISFVRANEALEALTALTAGLNVDETISSSRTEAFDTFQRKFLRSQIGSVQADLLAMAYVRPSLQIVTASQTAALALSYIAETINTDRIATTSATRVVFDLRRAADRGGVKARHSSVVYRGITGGNVENDIHWELNQAKNDLERGFKGRWSWLSLIGRLRVDDVGAEVSVYLDKRFGRNLERQVSNSFRDDCITQTLRSYSRPVSCLIYRKPSH